MSNQERQEIETRYTHFAARHGLVRSQARLCPRRVAGRLCVSRYAGTCECEQPMWRRLTDHGRVWWDPKRQEHVITGEPYRGAVDGLAPGAFDAYAKHLAATWHVTIKFLDDESPWFPGQTRLFYARPASLDELDELDQ